MSKPIRGQAGRFAGSIGDGKHAIPTPASSKTVRPRAQREGDPGETGQLDAMFDAVNRRDPEPIDDRAEEPIECIDAVGVDEGACSGPVEYRMPLSGTGRSFPRCDRHWMLRWDREEELRQRYPANAPSDFDPFDAGEAWDVDDY